MGGTISQIEGPISGSIDELSTFKWSEGVHPKDDYLVIIHDNFNVDINDPERKQKFRNRVLFFMDKYPDKWLVIGFAKLRWSGYFHSSSPPDLWILDHYLNLDTSCDTSETLKETKETDM